MSPRLCGAGFNFLVAVCAGGPPPSGGGGGLLTGVRWPLACAWRAGVALSHGCGRVSFLSRVCGGLLGLDPRLVSLALVLWCALVRRAVSCCALPCWSVLCCGALCSVVSCRAVSCRGVSCRGVAGCTVLCRAALCCAVLCRVVGSLVVVRCTAVRCGAVCRVASCCAVFRCAVVCGGPFSLPFRRGVGSALVRLARFVVRDAGRGYVAGWWLGGAVRCGVARWICVAGVRVGRSARWVRWASAGLPSLGACALVPCPLGVLAPKGVPGSVGWGVVASSGALGPLRSCPSASLPSPVLGVAAVSSSSSGACAVACVVSLAVARVVAWR